jgi:integrase/recombinase XerD
MLPLDNYLRHLSVERGLSKNTLSAYRLDLGKYQEFLADHSLAVETVVTSSITEFSMHLSDSGLKASSVSRILAAISGFHAFLVLEGIREDDPTKKVRPPKLPQRLPKALSQQQMLDLLSAAGPEPDDETADPLRLRDRAIVELMYSTGARVSEVVAIDLDEVDDSGLIRVRGKGSKERVVPIGSFAMRSIQAYLVRARPALNQSGATALFLNKRGSRLSRQSIWDLVQRSGEAIGLDVSPHALRH